MPDPRASGERCESASRFSYRQTSPVRVRAAKCGRDPGNTRGRSSKGACSIRRGVWYQRADRDRRSGATSARAVGYVPRRQMMAVIVNTGSTLTITQANGLTLTADSTIEAGGVLDGAGTIAGPFALIND